jgi:hypothetical protein
VLGYKAFNPDARRLTLADHLPGKHHQYGDTPKN